MNDEQVKLFSSSILISDVISYIDNHKEEYEKFLQEELEKEKEKNIKERGKNKNENTMYS